MTTTPTKPAMRAADEIDDQIAEASGGFRLGADGIAIIIDRETHLAELIEALNRCCDQLEAYGDYCSPACEHARDVLTRAEGGAG